MLNRGDGMKNQWWKSQPLFWIYSLVGAYTGGVTAPFLCSVFSNHVAAVLSADAGIYDAFSGVSGAFIAFIVLIPDVILGAVSGFLLVHACGKYRLETSIFLIVAGIFFALLATFMVSYLASSYGYRAALALFAPHLVWGILLLIGGSVRAFYSRHDEL